MQRIDGVGEVLQQCTGVLLDQFGVLHDGKVPYPHAAAAVKRLADAGKQIIVLSNSSRRSGGTIGKLVKMGFKQEWFTGKLGHAVAGCGFTCNYTALSAFYSKRHTSSPVIKCRTWTTASAPPAPHLGTSALDTTPLLTCMSTLGRQHMVLLVQLPVASSTAAAAAVGAITSGELTHRYLSTRPTPWWQQLGSRCIHITWSSRGTISLEGLGLQVSPP
jgi:hypothetical protein